MASIVGSALAVVLVLGAAAPAAPSLSVPHAAVAIAPAVSDRDDGDDDAGGDDDRGDSDNDDDNGGATRPTPAPAPDPERLREIARAMAASSDPAMRQLADQMLAAAGLAPAGPPPAGAAPQAPGAAGSPVPVGAQALFGDDFESGDLAKWGTCQGAGDLNGDCAGLTVDADGMGVVDDPGRGKVASFRITDGKSSEVGGERSEVRESGDGIVTREGDERWYRFSIKFPADLPEPDGGWYIVMQWHAGSGSPPLAIDISKGTVDLGGDGSDGPRATIGPLRRGEWVDYVLHVRFSRSDGYVEAWENGVQTVQRTERATMSSDSNYFKMGIYRDEDSTGDAQVFIDDFQTFDTVGAPSS